MMVLEALQRDLSQLDRQNRLRTLAGREGHDFSSNDYLGLATSPLLRGIAEAAIARGVAVGAGGSRLLRGNDCEHEALEAEAAVFFGSDSALYFGSGFAANAALFATLPQGGDLIVHDALIHASAHDGMRLGRARSVAVPHNDADAFADTIVTYRAGGGRGRVWIAVESLYSMDGDRAPLVALFAVAERHDAVLLIDEAHATGVFGSDGRGLAAGLEGRENVVTLRTCGKALGAEGALVCGSRIVRDFLVNRGRPFIFSTAPSPLMAAVVRGAIDLVRERPDQRAALHALVAHAHARLQPLGANPGDTQIIPLVLGEDARAMAVAAALRCSGFDVRGIRPPTVPEGTARLRLSITLNIGAPQIDALADALAEVLT